MQNPRFMHRIPTDNTLALVREGYHFILNRCQRLQTDVFVTRIMGRKTICLHGPDAARIFYDERKMQRHGALPRRIVTSLFGKDGVQTLDGEAHAKRKQALLSLMTQRRIEALVIAVGDEWRRAIARWQERERIVLFDEAQRILTSGTCAWAGVPLAEQEVALRARDFAAMVDAFGGIGPRLWRGKLARLRTELWLSGLIARVRRGALHVDQASALAVMARQTDAAGRLLPVRTAAVELINVIRPTVAVAWYVAFAALALHEHRDARDKIITATERFGVGVGDYADLFMQEVRRFYPFVPHLAAKVKAPFDWRGVRFTRGARVLLDIYGSNHDPRFWLDPERFFPERFAQWHGDAFAFIPQGGGDRMGHRCPGEWITMHLIELALHFLTRCMNYDVPHGQDLSIDLTRMPTRPASGLVITNVRPTPILAQPAPKLPSMTAAYDTAAANHHQQARH